MRPMRVPRSLLAAIAVVAVAVVASSALAKPKPKYHFFLFEVAPAQNVTGTAVPAAQPRVKAQAEKAFASHPQIVAKLDGAPDPKTDPAGYTAFLKKKKLAGAYKVNVEITEATEEVEAIEGKPGENRLVVRLGLRMFGETIPKRVMGFSGDGSATIKVEVGKAPRPRDKEYAWDEASKLAIKDAITSALAKLALPPVTPSKK